MFEVVPDGVTVMDTQNEDGSFTKYIAPPEPEQTPAPTQPPDPTLSYIDIGPFFDRFGSAKLPILMSGDPLVKALMADIQVRKWIDLKRPDVAQALDVLISKSLVTPALKTAILDTPISAEENMVLKKLYFS